MRSAKPPTSAIAGIDQSEPQIAAVKPKRRQHPPHTAGGIDDVSRGRMRVLIVLGVIGVVETDSRRCGADVGVASAQENRGVADRILGIDVRGAHRARAGEVILGIEPDHDQPVVDTGSQSTSIKPGRSKLQDRTAQRVTGVVGENDHGGHGAEGGRER